MTPPPDVPNALEDQDPSAHPVVGRFEDGMVGMVIPAVSGALGLALIASVAGRWPSQTVPLLKGMPAPIAWPESGALIGALYVVGLLLTWLGWVGLLSQLRQSRHPERFLLTAVVLVTALWSLPMLVVDPLLSNDAYSYAAQGEAASQGLDPTRVGPAALGDSAFVDPVDPTWREAPAPYGPIAIKLSQLAVTVAGHDPDTSAGMMRLIAMLGVVLTAAGVVRIAQQLRTSPSQALALGVSSPLVLIYFVGGSHNDALMMGLLTLGIAAMGAKHRALAVALVIAATAVKLPAVVGILFIGWNWSEDPDAAWRARASTLFATLAVSVAALVAMSSLAGLSMGWLTALSSTGASDTSFTLATKLGQVVADVAALAGADGWRSALVSIFRLAGLALAACVSLVLLVRSPRLGLARSVGLTIVVVMALGPVFYPWYLPAGLALLAATDMGRWRAGYIAVVGTTSALVWPAKMNSGERPVGLGIHLAELGVVILIIVVCLSAPRIAAWYEQRRQGQGARPQAVQGSSGTTLIDAQ
jgi:hypothetical protein